MSYGFEATNDEGLYQIDHDYFNYMQSSTGLVASGVLVSDLESMLTGNDLLFLSPASGTGTLSIYLDQNYVGSTAFRCGCSSGTIKYIITSLGTNHQTSQDTFGLTVFGAGGVPVFDSRYRPLNPIANGLVTRSKYTLTMPPKPSHKTRCVEASIFRPLGTVLNQDQPNSGYYVAAFITFESDTTISAIQDLILYGPPGDSRPVNGLPFFVVDI